MAEKNFLIGYGERLTQIVQPPLGGGSKKPAYSFDEAKHRLSPMIKSTSSALDDLPGQFCPNDEATAIVTLHPEYLAKSYFPGSLLRMIGLEAVGSKPDRVNPSQWTRQGEPEVCPTTNLIVAGSRQSFRVWPDLIASLPENNRAAQQLAEIESIRPMTIKDRFVEFDDGAESVCLEVVLHHGLQVNSDYVLQAFLELVRNSGSEADLSNIIFSGDLCFMPVQAKREKIDELASFSYMRVLRRMPKLRAISSVYRSSVLPAGFDVELPEDDAIDPNLRAAVFDGGVEAGSCAAKWLSVIEPTGIGDPVEEYLDHGLGVSSALLFGSIKDDEDVSVPFGKVDHYRVLDSDSVSDYDLYDVLQRIRSVLQSKYYPFVNISIGPYLPIEDDDVHVWTAVLDEHFSRNDTLAGIAVGNDGDGDSALGHDRVQVPSDCVNALGVGAASTEDAGWERAPYSSVGPGRSPGRIKPDFLAFGGSISQPFFVLSGNGLPYAAPAAGTSYAAPLAMRTAMGIRAHLGDVLETLAVKALMVHCAESSAASQSEIGWGCISGELSKYLICPDGSARVVYQGELTAGQYLRAPIPIPSEELPGNLKIKATFCYRTQVDPSHPSNYTRSGLDIVFRPHDQRFSPSSSDSTNPKSDSFFQLKMFSTEDELRRDAHKWETTLHREKTKRASSLRNPVFDIHYNARVNGGPAHHGNSIRYALVVSVHSASVLDLYDRIVRTYATQLEPLIPRIEIPITL